VINTKFGERRLHRAETVSTTSSSGALNAEASASGSPGCPDDPVDLIAEVRRRKRGIFRSIDEQLADGGKPGNSAYGFGDGRPDHSIGFVRWRVVRPLESVS